MAEAVAVLHVGCSSPGGFKMPSYIQDTQTVKVKLHFYKNMVCNQNLMPKHG